MTQAQMRIENLAHLTDAELTVRAIRAEQSISSYLPNHYSAAPTNMYREEIQRRQAVGAQELVAA